MSLSTKAAQACAGDPRRPDAVVAYKSQEEGDPMSKKPNGWMLMAMLCGACMMILRIRIMGMISLIFLAAALATKDANFDWQQLMSTTMFTVVGLTTNYILPLYQQYKANQRPTMSTPPAASTESPFS